MNISLKARTSGEWQHYPHEQLPLYVERKPAYTFYTFFFFTIFKFDHKQFANLLYLQYPCWALIIQLIAFFSGKVQGLNVFDFFSPLTGVPKEVSENSREFPEQSSQILKKSECVIYQHIQKTATGLLFVCFFSFFFRETRARGKIACIELLLVTR